jgi:peroxiredoxin
MNWKLTPRVALLLIAALFFVPLALAWMMHSGAIDYTPGATRNFGRLVEPPQPVDWSGVAVDGKAVGDNRSPFGGHWLVLLVVPNPCAETCRAEVTNLRQVHRASGRDQSRIRLALLHDLQDASSVGRLQAIYPEFHLVEDPSRRLWRTLDALAAPDGPAGAVRGETFLVDPLGNIMMVYEAGSDPNGLKKDLKRLLTWSKLDEGT